MRTAITGIGLASALIALSGCVPPPAPMVVEAPSPPTVLAAPVALVAAPPPVHHHVAAARSPVHHQAAHRHAVHRYTFRTRAPLPGVPYCGSVQRPCNVEHVTVSIQ